MTETGIARWLPPVLRDTPDGEPGSPRLLDALLAAADGQRALLEDDIDSLWHDFFIESCADWAVPYIGSLLGLPPEADRTEVAYAIALRRRKGTPAALEDFAEVVTGLTARAIEGWQVTLWAHRLGHPLPLRTASWDVRDTSRFRIGTPFERTRRSVTPGGRWSPRAVTAVVWPWQVSSYVATEAAPLPEPRRFALHPLGAHAPLYLKPRPLRLASDTGIAAAQARTCDEADAPVRATYDVMAALGPIGYGGSLELPVDHPLAGPPDAAVPPLIALTVGATPVPWSSLRFGTVPPGAPTPAPPAAAEVLVDPGRGVVEVGSGLSGTVRATWHRPVPGSIGALVCRSDADPAARVAVTVNPSGSGPTVVGTLAEAFALAQTLATTLPPGSSRPGVPDVEIRLETSDRLAAPSALTFAVGTALRWRIVAPPLLTPTVVGDFSLDVGGGCVSLEGFCLAGRLVLGDRLRGVTLDGITMDPASTVDVDATAWELAFDARRSVLAPIRAEVGALAIELTDCVVDGRRRKLRPCDQATGGPTVDAVSRVTRFGPVLHARGVTFAGPVRVEAIDAVDCLFADGVEVVQRQEGCLRHCYLGPDLSTPPARPTTYRCGPFPDPTFVSDSFEAAGYFALALEPEHPLLTAASDGGEIGAYHHARRGARIARLRRRIDEFVPLGLRASVAVAPWEE